VKINNKNKYSPNNQINLKVYFSLKGKIVVKNSVITFQVIVIFNTQKTFGDDLLLYYHYQPKLTLHKIDW